MNLGLPGNAATTLETMEALDGRRAHFAHVQFHSYGPEEPKTGLFGAAVGPLAEYVNTHSGVTVDVGQVMFGETTSMTADGAVGHFLAKLGGKKWFNLDVEQESGCGVVPMTYRDTNLVHAAAMGDRPGVVPCGSTTPSSARVVRSAPTTPTAAPSCRTRS